MKISSASHSKLQLLFTNLSFPVKVFKHREDFEAFQRGARRDSSEHPQAPLERHQVQHVAIDTNQFHLLQYRQKAKPHCETHQWSFAGPDCKLQLSIILDDQPGSQLSLVLEYPGRIGRSGIGLRQNGLIQCAAPGKSTTLEDRLEPKDFVQYLRGIGFNLEPPEQLQTANAQIQNTA